MKRYIKVVSLACALAATLCAGALAEGGSGIPKLAEGRRTAAPVVRAAAPEVPDIARLADAEALVKAAAFGEIDKSAALGTDGAPAMKNPVERAILIDDVAAEKSLALEGESAKKDVERAILIDDVAAEKSLALEGEPMKKDVERAILIDDVAAEKSLALEGEPTKKDVERAVAPEAQGISRAAALGTDGAYAARNDGMATEDNVERSVRLDGPLRAILIEGGSVDKAAALDDGYAVKDGAGAERAILVDAVDAAKSLAVDDAFAKRDIERAILIDDVTAVKSLALDGGFEKKADAEAERAVAAEGVEASKSGALGDTEPFVKRDAGMVDRAIEDEGATKIVNPVEPGEAGDVLRGASDEMIDKRVIAPGEISEKRTDKAIDVELGRDDIARGITLGEGGEVVRGQAADGSGIGRLGEGEALRP